METLKRCAKCDETKPVSEFYNNKSSNDGKDCYCKKCSYARKVLYRENNLEHVKKLEKARREKHKEARRKYRLRYRIELKSKVMTHYGGGICACVECGESRLPCLTIDHVDGSGADHRKKNSGLSGMRLYQKLAGLGYPAGYQTLCMNCQWVKRHEMGEHGGLNDRFGSPKHEDDEDMTNLKLPFDNSQRN